MENKKDFYIVGIGASAGGLDAIQQLFDYIPSDTGIAFVIIQHLSPDFVSLMPELLSKHTKMKIFTAEENQEIQPNCIYLNQRNKNLRIQGNKLHLLDKKEKHILNLPIDIFLGSLGEELKEKSVSVILSGTGSDGSRGIQSVKEHGGLIFAQDPRTAQFDGMPNSAIATNMVDFILSPEKIAEAINKLTEDRQLLSLDTESQPSNDVLFNNILEEVHKFSGIDFRDFKKNTLQRRLEKRIKVHNLDNLYDYLTLVKSNNEEKEAIKNDFLIGVSQFFRDKEAFHSLKKNVIPEIFKRKVDKETIRIWSVGCSTGQEVYSIAILIEEYIAANNSKIDYKIFATDVKAENIQAASMGSFFINSASEIDPIYLEKYFTKVGEKLQVNKKLREKVVFSAHNILTDPPFIKMDLILCRNLLIYLENKAQKKAMEDFHFALNKMGYLFLGNSESIGEFGKFYKVIDHKWKIYQNITDNRYNPYQFSSLGKLRSFSYVTPAKATSYSEDPRFKVGQSLEFYEFLSKKFSPTSLFIDKNFNILFIVGDAGKRLSHGEGLFLNNLLKIVNPDVALIIRNGIRRLEKEGKDILIKDVVQTNPNGDYVFDITMSIPNHKNLANTYFIQFSDEISISDAEIEIKHIPIEELSKQRYEDLERELKMVKTELQNVVEELETSNEELQSSNEELMASNEELQSTNEELQSVNEELYTVNAELQEKNKELYFVNSDINNLLGSTEIATLFLNKYLRIRKFTPKLRALFNLEETDLGRPIASFASNFDPVTHQNTLDDISKTLKTLHSIEKEIVDKDGHYYIQKISPFITEDQKVDGVVISYIDIDDRKRKEEDLQIKTAMLENTLTPMIVSDLRKGDILYHNQAFLDLIETTEINKNANANTMYVDPKLRKNKLRQVSKSGSMKQAEFEIYTSKGDTKWVLEYNEVIEYKGKKALFGSLIDYSELKKLDLELRKSEASYKAALEKLEKYNSTLVSVTSMLNGYLSNKEQTEVFEEVLTNLLELTGCNYGFIGDVKYRDDKPYLLTKALTDISWDDASAKMFKEHQKNGIEFTNLNTLFGQVLTSGELYISNDTKNDPNSAGIPKGHLAMNSFCGIPLKSGDEMIGMIGLANRPGGFKKDIIEELEIYLVASAQLIENYNDWAYRTQLQQETEAIAHELKLFIKTANAPIFGIDTKGLVNEWNLAAENITGYTKEEVLGKNLVKTYISPDHRKSVNKVLKNTLKGKGTANFEFPLGTKNGKNIMVLLNSTTRRNWQGEIVGVIGVGQDITEIIKNKENLELRVQQRTKELEASLEREKELNILKTRFVSMASHEFRTPLAAIKATSDVILKYWDKLDQNEIQNRLKKINNEVLDLTSMLEDVLILGKSDAQKLEFNPDIIDLKSLIPELTENFRMGIAKERKIAIDIDKGDYKLLADRIWIKQIINNLLSNAHKYSNLDKEIQIKLTDEKTQVRLSVKDFGIGISPKDKEHLFEAFHRGINVGNVQGTGLGLAVLQKAVELHNGKIELNSKLNSGSTFHIILPKNTVKIEAIEK